MSARSEFLAVAPEAEALPRRSNTPGTSLELLVLATDVDYCAGVDLLSGALVRAWSPGPIAEDLRPYDVVGGTLDDTIDLLPDPSQPEAVPLIEPPERIGHLSGRRVERYLRALVHPPGQPLLAIHGPAVPFWQRTADYPSIAVVEPEGPAVIRLRDGTLGLPVPLAWRLRRAALPRPATGPGYGGGAPHPGRLGQRGAAAGRLGATGRRPLPQGGRRLAPPALKRKNSGGQMERLRDRSGRPGLRPCPSRRR